MAGSSANLTGVCRNPWFEGSFVAVQSLQCACSLLPRPSPKAWGVGAQRAPFGCLATPRLSSPVTLPWGACAPLELAPCRHLGPAAPRQHPWQEACSTLNSPNSRRAICVRRGQIQICPQTTEGRSRSQ